MHHPLDADWGGASSGATVAERQARLEVVTGYLSRQQEALTVRVEHQGAALGRIFSRLDDQDRALMPVRERMARLEDLPARMRAIEDGRVRSREEKDERRALRREAMATAQWAMTALVIVGAVMGRVPEGLVKLLLPVLGFAK